MGALDGRTITVDGTAGVVLDGAVDTAGGGAGQELIETLTAWAGELTGRTGPLPELLSAR